MKLYIEGRRNGYDTKQCGRTMTVKDLVEYLEQFEDDTEVYLRNDNGYTYGSITEDSLMSSEELEEEDE